MDVVAQELRDSLVAAFRPYLGELLRTRGWPPCTAAIAAGEEWLVRELTELLEQPPAHQRRTPLEVFQEATAPVSAALEDAAVPRPVRDAAAVAALPGDEYDLAPASSAALGDMAWRSHLTWGSAKARAITRPSIAVLAANLLDRDRIARVVGAAGFQLEAVRGAGDVAGHGVLLVDLTDAAADATIAAGAAAGMRVIAFGPHVDEFAMVRARALGATEALPRSQFFRDLATYLPTVA